jgi:hypothetical protein
MDKTIASYVVMMDIDSHTNITQSIVDALDGQGVSGVDSGMPRPDLHRPQAVPPSS